jgi:hypothetical protein
MSVIVNKLLLLIQAAVLVQSTFMKSPEKTGAACLKQMG